MENAALESDYLDWNPSPHLTSEFFHFPKLVHSNGNSNGFCLVGGLLWDLWETESGFNKPSEQVKWVSLEQRSLEQRNRGMFYIGPWVICFYTAGELRMFYFFHLKMYSLWILSYYSCRQSWEVTTDNMWPVKPKIFICKGHLQKSLLSPVLVPKTDIGLSSSSTIF